MEVLVPLPADFNFDSTCSSPYISAPSSPKLFGELYFSAPTSPSRVSAFYRDFNNISFINRSGSSFGESKFEWEGIPREPKSNYTHYDDEDFAFDFSGQLDTASLTADELFDCGKIRPLELQSFKFDESATRKNTPVSSPRSPKSSIEKGKKIFKHAFSRKNYLLTAKQTVEEIEQERLREKEKVSVFSSSNSKHRSTKSLSPLELAWEEEQSTESNSNSNSKSSSSSSSSFFKWRLKDFLLFRSASEGQATEKHPLKKFTALSKKQQEEVKNVSFRSTDSSGSLSGSRRKGPVSAHELLYTSNRAVSDELKRKTFLPYKKGLLGCVGFNPTVQGLARGYSIKRV